MIHPLRDVVMLRRLAPDAVSAGGLYMAWDSDYKEDIGEVVYAGPGRKSRCPHCKTDTILEPVTVQPGDIVLFSTNGHQITRRNGEEFIVLREPSIIAVLASKAGTSSGTTGAERRYMGVDPV